MTTTETTAKTDVTALLRELARSEPGDAPVISVYLDTRWGDEHQRDRVRTFVKNEVRRAAAMAVGRLDDDLAWITTEVEALVRQATHPEAAGVAMFAGGPDPYRIVVPSAVPFADTFAVSDRARLRPFVVALGEAPRAVMLFVDGQSARLVALTEHGAGDDIALETADTIGHHRRGGWHLLMQSRYQRHIQEHRHRHFEAVVEALDDVVAQYGVRVIVLAGEARNLAVFRKHLRAGLATRIVGTIAGSRYEPSSLLAERALALVRHQAAGDVAAAVSDVLVEAEAGGRSAAGAEATIDAVNHGTVDRLYLLRAYDSVGWVCGSCRALQHRNEGTCRWCGGPPSEVDLGEAMVQRVLAAGGDIASLDGHAGLERAGGVAARLRYR
jgi:peptide subunit release factor 1 (eRF1)